MDVVTVGAILVGVILSVVSYFIFQWATREKGIHEVGRVRQGCPNGRVIEYGFMFSSTRPR